MIPIILDTDMESDVDDVGALAMLHALADRGEANILAVMLCAMNPDSAACANRVNTYYGRGDLPIGNVKHEGVMRPSKYAGGVAREFPGDLASGDDAPDAVTLYRRVLAGQPDGSVVLVTIGYMTNPRNLLRSGPDEHSHFDGAELVRRKVRLWVCMGGKFPEGSEANIRCDTPASVEVIPIWPTPILFSGWEIGTPIVTARRLHETPAENPVRRAYELFNGLKPHQSWDQAATLYAVRGLGAGPAADYWDYSPAGRLIVNPDDGSNTWQDDPAGTHRHKLEKRDPELIAEEIDELMTQPSRSMPGEASA